MNLSITIFTLSTFSFAVNSSALRFSPVSIISALYFRSGSFIELPLIKPLSFKLSSSKSLSFKLSSSSSLLKEFFKAPSLLVSPQRASLLSAPAASPFTKKLSAFAPSKVTKPPSASRALLSSFSSLRRLSSAKSFSNSPSLSSHQSMLQMR